MVLSGCATKPTKAPLNVNTQLSAEQRANQLTHIKQWQLRGKIAFIEQLESNKSKRESANIAWQVDTSKQTQELNLTSYLGINVLHLASQGNEHLIKVDGNEYRANNLSELIDSLTGLTLPTNALNYWLKGLPYHETDQIEFSPNSQLPVNLTSLSNNIEWQISYKKYKTFNGLQMATLFTIRKENLLIKIAINKWSLTR